MIILLLFISSNRLHSNLRGCFVVRVVVFGATVVVVVVVVGIRGNVEKQPMIDRIIPRAGRSSIVFKIVICIVETKRGLLVDVDGI
jgi:hypothetical protein